MLTTPALLNRPLRSLLPSLEIVGLMKKLWMSLTEQTTTPPAGRELRIIYREELNMMLEKTQVIDIEEWKKQNQYQRKNTTD